METFELNYSLEELKKRTDKEYLITKKFLDVDAPEYLALAEGDKKALKNLVKAAFFIQKINHQFCRSISSPTSHSTQTGIYDYFSVTIVKLFNKLHG